MLGKKHSDITKALMSTKWSGANSQWYGKSLPLSNLDPEKKKNGTKVLFIIVNFSL